MTNLGSQETMIGFEGEEEKESNFDFVPMGSTGNENTSEPRILRARPEIHDIHTSLSMEEKKFGLLASKEIKRINRELSRKIPPEIRENLTGEHSLLIKKKFKEGLSRKEEKRLQLIRWELDRIEDALYGESIDHFESFLMGYEKFANDINEFMDYIKRPLKDRNVKK